MLIDALDELAKQQKQTTETCMRVLAGFGTRLGVVPCGSGPVAVRDVVAPSSNATNSM